MGFIFDIPVVSSCWRWQNDSLWWVLGIDEKKEAVKNSPKDETASSSKAGADEPVKPNVAEKLTEQESDNINLHSPELPTSRMDGNSGNSAQTSQSNAKKNQSFDGVALPVEVLLETEIYLMDFRGQEVLIQKGAVIKVESRKSSGFLTVTINGQLFTGNETRMANKFVMK